MRHLPATRLHRLPSKRAVATCEEIAIAVRDGRPCGSQSPPRISRREAALRIRAGLVDPSLYVVRGRFGNQARPKILEPIAGLVEAWRVVHNLWSKHRQFRTISKQYYNLGLSLLAYYNFK